MDLECQLNGLSIVVPISKRKGHIRNCSCNKAIMLIQHETKVVKMVLEKKLCRIMTVNEIHLALCQRDNQLILCLS